MIQERRGRRRTAAGDRRREEAVGKEPRTPRPDTGESGGGYTARPTHEEPEDGSTRDHASEAVERSGTSEEKKRDGGEDVEPA